MNGHIFYSTNVMFCYIYSEQGKFVIVSFDSIKHVSRLGLASLGLGGPSDTYVKFINQMAKSHSLITG